MTGGLITKRLIIASCLILLIGFAGAQSSVHIKYLTVNTTSNSSGLYTLEVTGDIAKGALTEEHDKVKDNKVEGAIYPGHNDNYYFIGNISRIDLDGNASFYLEGEELNLTEINNRNLSYNESVNNTLNNTFNNTSGNKTGKGTGNQTDNQTESEDGKNNGETDGSSSSGDGTKNTGSGSHGSNNNGNNNQGGNNGGGSSGGNNNNNQGGGNKNWKKIVVHGRGDPADYTIRVTGQLLRNPAQGKLEPHDTMTDKTAQGRVIDGNDAFVYTGELTTFDVSGHAVGDNNGQLKFFFGDDKKDEDPFSGGDKPEDIRETGSDNTGNSDQASDGSDDQKWKRLYVVGHGERMKYKIRVTGKIKSNSDAPLEGGDHVSGNTAEGVVIDKDDGFFYTGEIIQFEKSGRGTVVKEGRITSPDEVAKQASDDEDSFEDDLNKLKQKQDQLTGGSDEDTGSNSDMTDRLKQKKDDIKGNDDTDESPKSLTNERIRSNLGANEGDNSGSGDQELSDLEKRLKNALGGPDGADSGDQSFEDKLNQEKQRQRDAKKDKEQNLEDLKNLHGQVSDNTDNTKAEYSTLTMSGIGERAQYNIKVTGKIEGLGGVERNDEISGGNSISGEVIDKDDQFRYTGKIVKFEIEGSATVKQNGKTVLDGEHNSFKEKIERIKQQRREKQKEQAQKNREALERKKDQIVGDDSSTDGGKFGSKRGIDQQDGSSSSGTSFTDRLKQKQDQITGGSGGSSGSSGSSSSRGGSGSFRDKLNQEKQNQFERSSTPNIQERLKNMFG